MDNLDAFLFGTPDQSSILETAAQAHTRAEMMTQAAKTKPRIVAPNINKADQERVARMCARYGVAVDDVWYDYETGEIPLKVIRDTRLLRRHIQHKVRPVVAADILDVLDIDEDIADIMLADGHDVAELYSPTRPDTAVDTVTVTRQWQHRPERLTELRDTGALFPYPDGTYDGNSLENPFPNRLPMFAPDPRYKPTQPFPNAPLTLADTMPSDKAYELLDALRSLNSRYWYLTEDHIIMPDGYFQSTKFRASHTKQVRYPGLIIEYMESDSGLTVCNVALHDKHYRVIRGHGLSTRGRGVALGRALAMCGWSMDESMTGEQVQVEQVLAWLSRSKA